ncbi:MAG: hypothetical protein IPO32_10735 [Crocinitomicaceae bacterium]|nr:hypothetical protein [Crocinitomicaceae bacterium]
MNGYLGANYNQQNSFGSSTGTTTDDSQRSLSSSYTGEDWNSWMYYQLKAGYQISENQKLTSGVRGNSSFGGSEDNTTTEYFAGNILETSNVSFTDPKYTWMNNSAYVNYQLDTDTNKSSLEINFNLAQKQVIAMEDRSILIKTSCQEFILISIFGQNLLIVH